MRRIVVLMLVGLSYECIAASPTPEQAQHAIEIPRNANGNGPARKTLDELASDYGVPGFAIALIDEFEIVWVKPYGIADVETGAPVIGETLFQAASISKPVAAMATMKAAQDGLLSLDTDVNAILKSWHVPNNKFTQKRAVTPRMLMSHTSGTDDGYGFPGYDPGAPLPTLVQVLDGDKPSNLGPVEWAAVPFVRFKYSGGAVLIMQLALQDVTGQPLEEIAREWVLDPIGMRNSFYSQPLRPELDARASRGHMRKGEAGEVKYHVYPELAAAGLWTTPEDLCKFALEVQRSLRGESNRVLNADSTREMVTPVGIGNFGVGFAVLKKKGSVYFGHTGGNWGFRCALLASRDTGVGYAMMTNSESAGPLISEVEKRLALVYGWPGFEDSTE